MTMARRQLREDLKALKVGEFLTVSTNRQRLSAYNSAEQLGITVTTERINSKEILITRTQ